MHVSHIRWQSKNSLTLRVIIATQCVLLVVVLVISAFVLASIRSELYAMKGQLTPVAPQGGASNVNITLEQWQYVVESTGFDD